MGKNGSERVRGKVVRWYDERGFGFIRPDVGDKDVFVHYSAISGPKTRRRQLEIGETVEFSVRQDQKGPRAENVERITALAEA